MFVCCLERYVWLYMRFLGGDFAQNENNSIGNINNSPKTTEQGTKSMKLMTLVFTRFKHYYRMGKTNKNLSHHNHIPEF